MASEYNPSLSENKVYDLPKGMKCPRCHKDLSQASGLSPGHRQHFDKNQILLCSYCLLICRVGDSSLVPLALEQVKKLPVQMQRSLLVAINYLKNQQKG